jgi:hypothetical protein
MKSDCSRVLTVAAMLLAGLFASAGGAWAGGGFPAPLVGVTGPYGVVAAGIAGVGYFLYKRYRDRR